MRFLKTQFFIGAFVLLAYIGVGIFGLFQFSHMSEAPMTNCPYAENGFSVCANGLDHINDWHQFSNATFPSLLISFLIFGAIWLFFSKQNFLNQQYLYRWKYYLYDKKLHDSPNKIIEWLSLFENSPSFLPKT